MGEDGKVTYEDSDTEAAQHGAAAEAVEAEKPAAVEPFSWWRFLKGAKEEQIVAQLQIELAKIIDEFPKALEGYCLLGLYEPSDSIDTWDANRIYSALEAENPRRDKNVLLVVASLGGRVEAAYQISKICKSFSKERFIVCVPRAAKSAATLVALGADEIHMGPLGELGPIDPQLGNLPALGVKKAIETIASVCERYPRSADAFANYMSKKISIEQIGYCERVAESAVQYAERLLSKKADLRERPLSIAKQLVYTYKHHGFVIDVEEARELLGDSWIISGSPQIAFTERVHQLLDQVGYPLHVQQDKKILVVGGLLKGAFVLEESPED